MKQLQNNFTTPEQSKKLLELGVPNKSADCCYGSFYLYGNPQISGIRIRENDEDYGVLPCWSVGRLIEIYEECVGLYYKHSRDDGHKDNLVESIIYKLEKAIDSGNNFPNLYPIVNFSKLND